MVKSDFKKLVESLSVRGVILQEYQHYLSLNEKERFDKLSLALKQQKINLSKYQNYLSQTSLNEVELAHNSELHILKKISLKLLVEAKLELKEVNQILKGFSPTKLNATAFLYQLMKHGKIKAEDFLELEDGNWTEVQDCPYKLVKEKEHLQFAFRKGKGIKKIGPYQIIGELGRGGMGVVYKCYHRKSNQTVALKVLLVDKGQFEKRLKRFEREIQTMKRLQHPGIIKFIAAGEAEEKPYLAMELVRGKSLDFLINEKSFTPRERILVICNSLKALHYAHKQKVIHRDLKLGNIFLAQTGEAKIGDFGLAKDLITDEREEQKLTRTGAILGTLNYMSPEQASGDANKLDARSDVYSMGVCLYRLLTKRSPHEAKSYNKLLHKILQEEPLPPSKFNPEIHQDLETILLKALEKKPEQRYQSALAFSEELTLFLEGIPIRSLLPNTRQKLRKWARRYQFQIFLTLFTLFFSLLLFLVFQGYQYQKKIKRFDSLFLDAFHKRKEAQEINSTDFKAGTQKIGLLLKALHLNNQALKLEARILKAEKQKWQIGNELIQLACKSHSFEFANFVALELQNLKSCSENEKALLFEQISKERYKISKQHQEKFNRWIALLQKGPITPALKADALFEIAQMPEDEIFLKLVEFLEEGNQYFSRENQSIISKNKEEYYQIIALILGRLGNKRAAKPLLRALSSISAKISTIASSKRSIAQIRYMVALAEALGALKASGTAAGVGRVRWEMGQHERLFWDRTSRIFQRLARIDKLAKKPAKNSFEYFERGFVKFNSRDSSKEAILDFTKAIELNPNFAEAYSYRGSAKCDLKQFEEGIKDYSKAIEIYPENASAYTSRGYAYFWKTDYKTAIKDFSKALFIDSSFTSAYNGRSISRIRIGEFEKAIQDCRKAIELDPRHIQAYNNLGIGLFTTGKFEDAIRHFNKAIEINPRYYESYYNRGLVKLQQGNPDAAIIDFTLAIELNPKYFEAYNNRGGLKMNKGDVEGAIADFTEAIQLNPKDHSSYANRGLAKTSMGDFIGAMNDFTDAILLQPKIARLYYQRGNAKYDNQDLIGAIADYTFALGLAPNDSKLYEHRGAAKYAKGDLKGALKDFDKTLLLAPQTIEVYFQRGVVKYLSADYQGAKSDFIYYLKSSKNNAAINTRQTYLWIFSRFPELKK